MFKQIVLALIVLFNISFAADKSVITLATTTSTENSGLLAYLLPEFSKETGVDVRVIAVGSGKALKLGENGDVDVLLVHAPKDEAEFVKKGFGVNHRKVMHNDFVFVGPQSDSAVIGKVKSAPDVLKTIAATKSIFIARGDDSGTDKKEKELWAASTIVPSGDWYRVAGQGMEAVLIIANEKLGYTLTDRGTYLAIAGKIELKVLFEGDSLMFNPYGVIAVNPERHPNVKFKDATKFIEWLVSKKGQALIGGFKVNGKQLFYPDAL